MAAFDGLKQQASSRALQMAHEYAPMAEAAAKGAASDALNGLHGIGAKAAEKAEKKAKGGMGMMDKAMMGMMGVQTVEDLDGSKEKEAAPAPYAPNIIIGGSGGYAPIQSQRRGRSRYRGAQYGYVN